jgi:hypothetical protein
MRGKVATQIRRTAERMAVGMPPVAYGRHNTTGAIWLVPKCTRSACQKLKKKFKEHQKCNNI